jgi:phosphoglycerate dehydrogenase-like enzyme
MQRRLLLTHPAFPPDRIISALRLHCVRLAAASPTCGSMNATRTSGRPGPWPTRRRAARSSLPIARHPVDATVLAARPANCVAVLRCAVDIRTIDVSWRPAHHGVLVTRASRRIHGLSVSEWVIGVMIDLSRSHQRWRRPVTTAGAGGAAASWAANCAPPRLGVIGYGQIARYLCPVAQAFGMQVLRDRPLTRTVEWLPASRQVRALPELLLAQSDYLSCAWRRPPRRQRP